MKFPEGKCSERYTPVLGHEEMAHNAIAVKPSTVLLLDVKRVLTMCSSACRFHGRLIHNLLTVYRRKKSAAHPEAGAYVLPDHPKKNCSLICRSNP